jgi:hypothetical protein
VWLAGTFTGGSVRGTLSAIGRAARRVAADAANPYGAIFGARAEG